MTSYPSIAVMVVIAMLLLLLPPQHVVRANLAPSYPEPGTIWTAGKEYKILWEDDGSKPRMDKAWKNFRIDLMTGDNMKQVLLTNVASNISAENGVTSLRWKAPNVTPSSAVYFFTFTNEHGDNAWTTRFAIVGDDGKLDMPEHPAQPSGEKIPWGTGKLITLPKKQVAQEKAAAAPGSAKDTPAPASSSSMDSTSADPATTLSSSIILDEPDTSKNLIATKDSSAALITSSSSFWLSMTAWFIVMTMRL